jgi:predicted DNA-binding transcriptional regulator AlpA
MPPLNPVRVMDEDAFSEYQPQIDDDELVDVNGAAAMLSISPRTLYNWKLRHYGPTPVKPTNGLLRWRKGDVRRWIHGLGGAY